MEKGYEMVGESGKIWGKGRKSRGKQEKVGKEAPLSTGTLLAHGSQKPNSGLLSITKTKLNAAGAKLGVRSVPLRSVCVPTIHLGPVGRRPART